MSHLSLQNTPKVRLSHCAFALIAVLLCACLLPRAFGQAQTSGTIGGRVTDSTGAAIPGATITLKSQESDRVVIVTANAQGEYVFNGVPVSTYTVTIESPTFGKYEAKDLTVNAGENEKLDAILHPASENASVVVEAEGTTVDTRSGTIGTVIDNALVENLPLDGNNVVELAALLPGVTDVNAPTTFTGDGAGPTYNISGARANQNLLLFDGALYNNLYNNTGLNFPPRQGLQEVSVLLNNFKAQYGRNVGSVFNVISKSGSNTFHGELWDFIQNKALNAYDYITKANPHLVQNQFGATFGGPILRDKAYFFLTYQDLRSASAVTTKDFTLDYQERGLNPNGTPRACAASDNYGSGVTSCANFAESVTAVANPIKGKFAAAATTALQTAWNVAGGIGTAPCIVALSAAGTSLPNFDVPNICFNPVTQRLNALFPVQPVFNQGVVTQANQPRNDQDGLARVDVVLGRHTVAARYYQTNVNDLTANGVSGGAGIATYEINRNTAAIFLGNIDDTWVLTPNMLNIFRAAYKRYNYGVAPTNTTTLSDLGAVLPLSGHPSLPRISIDSRFSVGSTSNSYLTSVNEDIEGDDSISYTRGAHNFQAGVEYLRLQYLKSFDEEPTLTYSNDFTNVPVADFMFGLVSSSDFGNATPQAAIQHDLYLYAQDDWRASPRLTINLGLRYEIPFQWYQPNGYSATFLPGYQSIQFPGAPPNVAYANDPGIQKSLVGTGYNNLAPRLGFAYDVFGNGKLSIRGGFGIFYDAINASVVGITQPFHYQETPTVLPGGTSEPLLQQAPVPANYVRGQPAVFTLPYSITFPDKNFTTPYTEAMNFGFQEHVSRGVTFEMNYVARLGRHEALGYDLNPAIYDCSGSYFQAAPSTYCLPAGSTSETTFATSTSYIPRLKYPNFNYGGAGVLDYMTTGTSSYNAIQSIVTVRGTRTLTGIFNYTFSKSLDVSSNGTSIVNSTDQPSLTVHNALSDFDTRQIFNLGAVFKFPVITRGNSFTRAVLNDWAFNAIYSARTGHPFSVTSNGDQTLRDEKPEFASFVAGGYVPLSSARHRVDKINEWFNTSSICLPEQYTNPCPNMAGGYGNAPRNYLHAPAFINTQLSLLRTFHIPLRDSMRFVFRVDAFNALNTPNLGVPGSALSSSAAKGGTFGKIVNTVGGNGAAGTNGRRLQLSGSLFF